jgi:hypothetical protein
MPVPFRVASPPPSTHNLPHASAYPAQATTMLMPKPNIMSMEDMEVTVEEPVE